LAALTTSAIGITAANPADVVKVRFQAQHSGSSVETAAGLGQYRSAVRAYFDIARSEGIVGGLYKGYGPNLLRNSIISATEIVTYDVTKQELLRLGLEDSPVTHFAAGTTAGFAATVLGSPWDVLGTRLMADTSKQGVLPYIAKMLRDEGISSFYKVHHDFSGVSFAFMSFSIKVTYKMGVTSSCGPTREFGALSVRERLKKGRQHAYEREGVCSLVSA
jgi:solute carrier family 25 (mitochondrial uncoupling protein), member 8/9